jgi:hypothetical protein
MPDQGLRRAQGQLLALIEKHKGGRPEKTPGQRRTVSGGKTLSDMGISHGQTSKWQQLAAVPEDQFEAALAAPKPSM